MKRFEFSLERAKRYRESQQRLEEARYSMLASSEASIAHRIDELRVGHLEQRKALARNLELDATELERLHEYGEFVSIEVARLRGEHELLRKELARQALKVAQCRQGVELLEKLKSKQRIRWSQAAAKELQEAAEESYNSRWLRESRDSAGKAKCSDP